MSNKSSNWIILAICSLSIGSSIAIIEIILWSAVDSLLPTSQKVINFSRPGTLTLLSSGGKIIQKLGPATQEKLSAEDIPILIKQSFISAEDRRFYQHKGVDLWGISRALFANLRQGSVKEGGSTITQQLARTVFLNQSRTITRKIKEIALAFKLERKLSKEKILQQYLNYVYLGSGAYGIADAAWVYFSKTPNLLSISEAALIAGLAPAPSLYSPLVNPKLAIKRREIVLIKMAEEKFISMEELSTALKEPLSLMPAEPKYQTSIAPFFTNWVAQKLPEFVSDEDLEIGGITIRTSLKLDWQRKATSIIQEYTRKEMEGAAVSIEPISGLVRVLVGGKNFQNNQFNRATQATRSPGSTFKIFPYLAALKKGIKPSDIFIDKKKCWGTYCPRNFGNKYMGKVSLSEAFSNSLNTIAVEILDKVGFKEVISLANKLGVGEEKELGTYYPLAIGAYEETLINMTSAYATIANRGYYIRPSPIEEIVGPSNNIIWTHKLNDSKGEQAIEIKIADTMNSMLQKVVSEGTGQAGKLNNRNVAGKTGTSEGGRDLWFIGSIPQLTTGIWFGYDDNRQTKLSSGEAANAWKQFMLRIITNFEKKEFES